MPTWRRTSTAGTWSSPPPRSPPTLEKELSTGLKSTFGHSVDVCVRSQAELKKILAANPYPDGDPSKVTVAFLTASPPAGAADRIAGLAKDHEPFTIWSGKDGAGTVVYVHYGNGLGRSELAEKFSKTVGVSATVRNIRTVEKVLGLMG